MRTCEMGGGSNFYFVLNELEWTFGLGLKLLRDAVQLEG